MATFYDFQKLDMRVGEITRAEVFLKQENQSLNYGWTLEKRSELNKV